MNCPKSQMSTTTLWHSALVNTVSHQSPSPRRLAAVQARFVADLVTVAVGVALIVADYFFPQPRYPSSIFRQTSKYDSGPDPSSIHWLSSVGFALVIVFGVLAAVHRRPRSSRRHPVFAWTLAILGIPVGAYLMLSSIVVTGIVGERTTAPATATSFCHEMLGLAHSSDWYVCEVRAHWPDGSTSTVQDVPVDANERSVVLAKPKFAAWPFSGGEHRYKVSDLVALLTLGAVCVLRAILSVILLLVDKPSRDQRTLPVEPVVDQL